MKLQIFCTKIGKFTRLKDTKGNLFNWLQKNGIQIAHTINSGGKFDFGFGTVKCVSSQYSGSFIDANNQEATCGFVFKTVDGNFYYSGDTALTSEVQSIHKFSALNFAVFPISDGLTKGIEEVIEASEIVEVEHGFRGPLRYYCFY